MRNVQIINNNNKNRQHTHKQTKHKKPTLYRTVTDDLFNICKTKHTLFFKYYEEKEQRKNIIIVKLRKHLNCYNQLYRFDGMKCLLVQAWQWQIGKFQPKQTNDMFSLLFQFNGKYQFKLLLRIIFQSIKSIVRSPIKRINKNEKIVKFALEQIHIFYANPGRILMKS